MMPNAIIPLGILALSLACAAPDSTRDRATEPMRVIDSSLTAPSWNTMSDSVVTYRLEVRSAGTLDTLTAIVTPLPVLVDDSLIVGLRVTSRNGDQSERQLFRHNLSSGRLESWALPADVWAYYHDVVPSPNGRYFAYVASSDSGTVAVIRELGTGREVRRAGAGGGCDCDVDRNHARWFAPDSFEVAVDHTHTGRGWEIVAARASGQGLSITQVDKEPEWHASRTH